MNVEAEVVIVGGGPSGLAAALCLGDWGVHTVLLERRTSSPRHPQATMVNVRTTEILRALNLLDDVEAHSTPLESSARVSFLSSLTGEEIGKLEMVESDDKLMRLAALSPTLPTICPQHSLQDIFLAALKKSPTVTVLQGSKAKRINYDGTLVEISFVGPDGSHSAVRAAYAVLAEGLHGSLRSNVGIEAIDSPPLGRLLDIYFNADLTSLTSDRESALYWVVNQHVRGVLITVAPRDGDWLLEIPALDGDQHADLLSGSTDYHALVNAAVGADLHPTIRSVRTWPMGSTVANRWHDAGGRVFVIGDAAHTFPPAGGFGMNTGIQDAHNLSWKLAGVIHGWAGPRLLNSYEPERRPVADFNATQSTSNAVRMREFLEHQAAPFIADLARPGHSAERARAQLRPAIESQRPHFDFYGQALGFRYRRCPRTPSEVVEDVVNYVPAAEPGARAPHFWLQSGEERLAIQDLCKTQFALLVATNAAAVWTEVVARLHAATSIPISCYCVVSGHDAPGTAGLTDPEGAMLHKYGLVGSSAVLLRPDGHIGARLAGNAPDSELEEALIEILTYSSNDYTEACCV